LPIHLQINYAFVPAQFEVLDVCCIDQFHHLRGERVTCREAFHAQLTVLCHLHLHKGAQRDLQRLTEFLGLTQGDLYIGIIEPVFSSCHINIPELDGSVEERIENITRGCIPGEREQLLIICKDVDRVTLDFEGDIVKHTQYLPDFILELGRTHLAQLFC